MISLCTEEFIICTEKYVICRCTEKLVSGTTKTNGPMCEALPGEVHQEARSTNICSQIHLAREENSPLYNFRNTSSLQTSNFGEFRLGLGSGSEPY